MSDEITIYADGAASPNPGLGGYGVVLLCDGQRRELSGGFRRTTNNRMEILGAIVGLRALNGTRSRVTIYSDSKYVVDMFNGGYAEKWRQNGWWRNKGKDPALNPDLWGELLDLAARHEVRFVWVRGHADNLENARCDELAVAARQVEDLPPDPGYETPAAPEPPQPNFFDLLNLG
jgi:ribonuclease HI